MMVVVVFSGMVWKHHCWNNTCCVALWSIMSIMSKKREHRIASCLISARRCGVDTRHDWTCVTPFMWFASCAFHLHEHIKHDLWLQYVNMASKGRTSEQYR
jgi:type IV secretory pathway VirB3-like protein